MKIDNMNIVELPIESVHPYEQNPRDISQAIPLVMNSIREFGFRNPIIVDKRHIIITGHTRYAAAIELGLEKVPCIISTMSPEKAKAFRIADNKTGEFASWDFEKLDEELAKAEDLDMEGDFGFISNSNINRDEMFGEAKEPKEPAEKEDEYIPCPCCGHLNKLP